MTPILREAIKTEDIPKLNDHLQRRFGVSATDSQWRKWLFQLRCHWWDTWSDCTLNLFLKNRMGEEGLLPAGCKQPEEWLWRLPLHFFWIYLDSSPEMLERCRRERRPLEPTYAASKLATTNLKKIKPVNRTTGKVAPVPPGYLKEQEGKEVG